MAAENSNIEFVDDFGVTKYMLMADAMVSDTSSTIYEMLLLDKPVITLQTVTKDPYWKDISDASQLLAAYDEVVADDRMADRRRWIIDNYDPYCDGQVAHRMLEAVRAYIGEHGVPEQRRLNLWRKYVSIRTFGRPRR